MSIRYLIASVDPGITKAFALLDLNGNLVRIESSKRFSKRSLLKRLVQFGIPIIIATDVNPCPSFVSKIASKLKVRLVIPEESLSMRQKQKLISNFRIRFKNDHERDALASAMFAYKLYKPLFDRIEKEVPREKINEVKKKLVLREARNIKEALE